MPTSARNHRKPNFRRLGAVGALACVVVGLLLLFAGLGKTLVEFSYDLPYLFSHDRATDDVVIITMTENSATALKQPPDERLWDRSIHAQLLRQPCIRNARLVVFDVIFKDPTTNDSDFALALHEHHRVLLAEGQVPEDVGILRIKAPSISVEALASNAAASASADLRASSDGAIRQHSAHKGLAWMAAELAGKHPPSPSPNRWINFYGGLPSVPYNDVLLNSNAFAPFAFSNKVVFVGGKGQVITKSGNLQVDTHPTALTRWNKETLPTLSGVEIQATAFLNLAQNDWLTQSPVWAELMMVLLAGSLFGGGLVFIHPWRGALLGAIAVVALAGLDLYLVTNHRIWYPWAIPALVQIPLALGWAILIHTRRLYWEKEELVTELASAKTAAEAFKSEASAKSLPPVDTLSAVIIADHVLLSRIGSGAYGEVWLARNLVGLYVAVKIIRRSKFSEDAPYQREFKGIKKFMPVSMRHPGLLRVLHIGQDVLERNFFYIMEAADDEVRGQRIDPAAYTPKTLHSVLQKCTRLPLVECAALGLSLSEALACIHENQLIHRDLKPSNIIFVNSIPKIADIGLVTDLGGLRTSVTSLGTSGYMAPEGPGTAAADLFGLGKVLYEAFTGLSPNRFPEIPPRMLIPTPDDGFIRMNRILLRACESNATDRYQSARELHADLEKLCGIFTANPSG
jgi:CHASE2 domain-containing sensor protein